MSADASSKSKSPAITKAKKANLTLGVTRIDRALRKSRVCKNVGSAAAIYATALCEEIVDDILVRAGEDATHKKSKRIAVCHLISSVRSNPDTAMLLQFWIRKRQRRAKGDRFHPGRPGQKGPEGQAQVGIR